MVGFDGHKRVQGTKIHAAVAEGSLPVAVAISPANVHEGTRLIPLMESVSIETGHRPRRRPRTLYADTGYQGPKITSTVARTVKYEIEIVKRIDRFVVLPGR